MASSEEKSEEQLLKEVVLLVERAVQLANDPDALAWNVRKCAEALLALRIKQKKKPLPRVKPAGYFDALLHEADIPRRDQHAFTTLKELGNLGAHFQASPADSLEEKRSVLVDNLVTVTNAVLPKAPDAMREALAKLRRSVATPSVGTTTISAGEAATVLASARRALRPRWPAIVASFLVGATGTTVIAGRWHREVHEKSPEAARETAPATIEAKSTTHPLQPPPTTASPAEDAPNDSPSSEASAASPLTELRVAAGDVTWTVPLSGHLHEVEHSVDRDEAETADGVAIRLFACSKDTWADHYAHHTPREKDTLTFTDAGREGGRMFVERCRYGMKGPHVCLRILYREKDEKDIAPLLQTPKPSS